jgi:acyl carrier protein
MSDFRDKLRSFICEKTWVEQDELEDDAPLFSSGIIGSLDLLDLVVLVESELNTKVTPGQLSLANFDSINKTIGFSESLSD